MKSRAASWAFRWTLPLVLIAGVAGLIWLETSAQAASNGDRKGTVEMIKVHGKSLEGNLEGDSPDRDVFVYLPPSYATDKNRHYPVVYFLHGYGANAEAYWKMMTVPETADKEMTDGTVHEMILVNPDAYTIYSGSMYSNSPTTGDWETYITHDLVNYIDSHYRTIANRDSRGLAGHSMGGYGTLRLAMKYPEVYSSIYAMSSCCLMNNPGAARPPATSLRSQNQDKGEKAGRRGLEFSQKYFPPRRPPGRRIRRTLPSFSTCRRRTALCGPRSRRSGSPTRRSRWWISTLRI